MSRKLIRCRLLHSHSDDCSAIQTYRDGFWDSPWYLPMAWLKEPRALYRDSLGRKTRGLGEQWLVFKCNTSLSAPCPATLLVALKDIEKLLPGDENDGDHESILL